MLDLADDPFVSEVIPLTGKIDERAYVDCLEKASREIEEAQEHLLTSVREVAESLGNYANRDRYEKFLQVWAEHQDILWPLLNMLVLREVAPWEDASTSETYHGEVDVDESGDFTYTYRFQGTYHSRGACRFPGLEAERSPAHPMIRSRRSRTTLTGCGHPKRKRRAWNT